MRNMAKFQLTRRQIGHIMHRLIDIWLGMNISSLYDLRSLVQLDSLTMPKSYCHRTLSVKCIVVSLNRTSATAVQSGACGGTRLQVLQNSKTVPLEL